MHRDTAAFRRLITLSSALLMCAAPLVSSSCFAQETFLPQQIIFPPLPLDPLDFEQPKPIEIGLRVYHLPDSRRGENYTVGGWVGVGSRHAFAWEFAYAGIEDAQDLRYGGGAPRWQWTTHLARPGTRGFAIDVAAGPPVGDETLHPLTGRAFSFHGRLRYSPLGGAGWRLWLGYWGQGVSIPESSALPSSVFPSGHGFDVACHGATRRLAWEVWAHGLRGNLPENFWLETSVAVYPVADLGLRLGATVTPGPKERRLMDLGWRVAVSWRPSPLEEEEGDGGSSPAGGTLSGYSGLRYP